MNIEQTLLEVVRELPTDQQQEIVAYARRLGSNTGAGKPPRMSGRGLWADLKIDLSADDIDEVRREMLKDFPRERL